MSRRRRARNQASGGSDWIWAVALLVFALVFFGGGFLLLRTVTGGSGASCDKQQFALGSSDLSEAGFQAEDASLSKVESLLSAGRTADAESAFYQNSHGFTHDADAKIRAKNVQAATDLCNSVLTIETDLDTQEQTTVLVADAERVRSYLRQSAQSLGYNISR